MVDTDGAEVSAGVVDTLDHLPAVANDVPTTANGDEQLVLFDADEFRIPRMSTPSRDDR